MRGQAIVLCIAANAVVARRRSCFRLRQNSSVGAMNALLVITPYKYQSTCLFDDPAVGLLREPFIAGIDTMIDKAGRRDCIAGDGVNGVSTKKDCFSRPGRLGVPG